MDRRLNENFTLGKKMVQDAHIYMRPWRWQPSGWKYPFLHHEDPPKTHDHITKRYRPYKSIANEKLKSNYFKTSYHSQFKERIGFQNIGRKMKTKNSGFSDTDRLNEYQVVKGVPEHSNYISAWYPPIPIGNYGSNDEYLKLKKYSPFYLTEKRNIQTNNFNNTNLNKTVIPVSSRDIEDEEWFLKCKNDKRELYKRSASYGTTISNSPMSNTMRSV